MDDMEEVIAIGGDTLEREHHCLGLGDRARLAGVCSTNGLIGKTNDEIRESIGDKFPKHIYHSIVCIGALIAHREQSYWAVDAIGAPYVGERTEAQLISPFVDRISLMPRSL